MPADIKVKIKVCGITNYEDASLAVSLGAHAIGFIFADSPRQVEPAKAKAIISDLPPFVKTVGVFVNEDLGIINNIIDSCGLDLVQLHGDESPEICEALMPRVIKAFQLRDESSLDNLKFYKDKVKAFLFDTYSKGKRGGTGKVFNWDLAVKGKQSDIPVILAGGLSPSNLLAAIETVKPYAIDLNSGIEDRPGKKSPQLLNKAMRLFY